MLYNLDINNRAFKAIKEKRKKIEIRATKVNGFDYSVIKPNDIIKFTSYDSSTLKCKVLRNTWYPTIEKLLTKEGVEYTLSSTNNFDEGVKSINSLDGYKEAIKLNGVHAIELELINNILLSDLDCLSKNIDLKLYIEYMDYVKSTMKYPEWLGDFTIDDIEHMIESGSKIWIYTLNNEFVCSMMFIPSDTNGLNKMGLEKYDESQVAECGPVMVSPNYLGNNLQYQMLQKLDEYCKKMGYTYLCSTIHPDNIYSINNFIKDNYKLECQKTFKRGIRNIYFKQL